MQRGRHLPVSNAEALKREAVLRIAERHFTADEFAELMSEMADGQVDIRIYEDGIVLTRKF
jgi:hypothetical protein